MARNAPALRTCAIVEHPDIHGIWYCSKVKISSGIERKVGYDRRLEVFLPVSWHFSANGSYACGLRLACRVL